MKTRGFMVSFGILVFGLAPVCAGSAEAATIKFLMSVGNNVGDPDDVPLQYADVDAQRVAQLLVEIGGVTPERAVVVMNQPASVVRERLTEMAGSIAELSAAGHDVIFLLYVSAHAKGGELHLKGTRLPLSELRDFAQATRARLRVLIIDACDSGAIARRKGGSVGTEYEVAVEKLPLAGQVVVSSSGPAEPSQEWDSLAGSLFTHHLLTGLRGDADAEGDGRVTLAEAYGYTYRRTLINAALGSQHPSFDFDLAGTGEVVLAEPAAGKSALLFPSGLEGRYVVASQPRPDVVAEVEKQAGRPLRLAVPPGRYVVRKRLGPNVGLINVELPYGGVKTVDESSMVKRNFTEVAIKGGYVELRPSSLMVLSAVQTEPLYASGARVRFGAAYRHTWGEKWLLAGATFGRTSFRGVGLQTNETAATIGVSAGYRLLITPVVPYIGVSLELVGLWQNSIRDQEQDIGRVFGRTPLPPRNSVGVSFGPVIGIEVPMPANLFTLVSAQGLVRHLPVEDQPRWTLGLQGFAAFGWRF